MKKLKGIVAALLSVSVIASAAALTACGGNDDGKGSGNNKPIDEATWKAAFEDLDYTNFSARGGGGILEAASSDFEVKVSENLVYFKEQRGDEYLNEFYCVKNEDGMSVTYRKMYRKIEDDDRPDHNTIEDAKYFIDTYTTFEQAVASAKAMVLLEVTYKDCYNSFTYNESKQEYVCSGAVEVSQTYRIEELGGYDDTLTYHCVNNSVKISDDKIISYSFKVNLITSVTDYDNGGHEEDSTECDASLNCFNIGTTSVTVPPEVIAEATANSPID